MKAVGPSPASRHRSASTPSSWPNQPPRVDGCTSAQAGRRNENQITPLRTPVGYSRTQQHNRYRQADAAPSCTTIPALMLLPHPLLRVSDLRRSTSRPNLRQLIRQHGVHEFYNARAAIYQLARFLRGQGRSTILLPSFHCPSVVEPVLRAGMRPAFYRIDRNLELDASDVASRLSGDVAAVLFINYLGWPSSFDSLLDDLRSREILAVEDCAHAAIQSDPLDLAGRRGDAAIYSFWKFVPSGVGGGLWLADNVPFVAPRLTGVPVRDSLTRGKQLLEEVIQSRGEHTRAARAWSWFEERRVRVQTWLHPQRRQTHRQTCPSDAADLSPDEARQYFFSERLAQSRLPRTAERIIACADLPSLTSARRQNYQTLGSILRHNGSILPVHSELPANISPHAFAVMLADRSRHDRRLRTTGVPVWTFGSTLHRVLRETADAAVISDARYLSETMLLIPVHQLLTMADMTRFGNILNRYAAKEMPCKSN